MQAIRPCFSTFVNFSPLNLVNIYSASLQYERHPPRSGSDLIKIDRGTLLTTSPLSVYGKYIILMSRSVRHWASLSLRPGNKLTSSAELYRSSEFGMDITQPYAIRRKFLGHFLPFSQQRLSPVSGSGVAVLPRRGAPWGDSSA